MVQLWHVMAAAWTVVAAYFFALYTADAPLWLALPMLAPVLALELYVLRRDVDGRAEVA